MILYDTVRYCYVPLLAFPTLSNISCSLIFALSLIFSIVSVAGRPGIMMKTEEKIQQCVIDDEELNGRRKGKINESNEDKCLNELDKLIDYQKD